MEVRAEKASVRVRVAGVLLIAGLLAGPVGTHLYWLAGGAWGLQGQPSSTGIRVVAGIVVMLLVAAVLVVLARVGWWQPAFVSDRVIRVLAWGIALFFLGHGLVSFVEGSAGIADEWWMYGPAGLALGLLALVVAGSGGARPHLQRMHETLPSN